MRRTCNGCRAADICNNVIMCDLGYIVKTIYSKSGSASGKPLENCPKPLTYEKLYELLKEELK